MESTFLLHGKTILVTGASSGIGKQTAIAVSKAGGTLVITGRNEQRLKETLESLDQQGHIMIPADLTLQEDRDRLLELLPGLDGIVHSAGITGHLPVKFLREDDVVPFFATNYTAPVLTTAAILKKKKLKSHASVVFLSSIATRYPYFGGALYCSTKAAIEAYSKVLALELAPKGIRSNCVSPSFVKTPMVEGAAETISNEVLEKFEKMMPLGFGEPDDVANAIVYLLSDAAKWITGTNLQLGGG